MGATAKGVPYPADTDAPDGPAQIKAVADYIDAQPGISALTYAQITALTGAQLWPGRIVYQTNTGTARPNQGRYEWNGVYWGLPWNQAWGLVTETLGGTASGVTAQADVTGLTMTFTAIAHRRYLFKVQCRVSKSATAGECAIFITTAGNTVQWQSRQSMTANGVKLFKFDYADPGLAAGSITRKVRVQSFTDTCVVDTDGVGNNYLAVYDDGPAGVPA